MFLSARVVSVGIGIVGVLTALACGGGAADLTGYTATVQSWVGHDGNTLVRTSNLDPSHGRTQRSVSLLLSLLESHRLLL